MTPAEPKSQGVTPSQTIGPFFHGALEWACKNAAPESGDVRIEGTVLDGSGAPVDDALLEIWQPSDAAMPSGRVAAGFQRAATDAAGRFAFTVRKLPTAAAVAHVTVLARGLLNGLRTRVYLGASPGEIGEIPGMLARDGVRELAPGPLATLIAVAGDEVYRWDVRLQGDEETVFFQFPQRQWICPTHSPHSR